jgi:hypothetical protein
MQRSRISLFIVVVLLVLLALPAIARADETTGSTSGETMAVTGEPTPDGWTWDEAPPAPELLPDGWTWDEAGPEPEPLPDGWTWDEAAPAEPVSDAETPDEAASPSALP